MDQEQQKRIICDDLKQLDTDDIQINVDQIKAVFPSRIHPNNKKMKQNGKGVISVIFEDRYRGTSHTYLRRYNKKCADKKASFGRIVPHKSKADREEDRIYYRYIDEVAKETEPFIIKEFKNLDNCLTCIEKNMKDVENKMRGYDIQIANRKGRGGTPTGPNKHLIRKPKEGKMEVHTLNFITAYSKQLKLSLQKRINSLKRSQSIMERKREEKARSQEKQGNNANANAMD